MLIPAFVYRNFARVVTLTVLWISLHAASACAQPMTPGTITLRDGTPLNATILLYIPGVKLVVEQDGVTRVYAADQFSAVVPVAGAAPVVRLATGDMPSYVPSVPARTESAMDLYRAHELSRLAIEREKQRARIHRWQAPAVSLAVGATSLIIGATVFAMAWRGEADCFDCTGYNARMDRTGLIMMPIGAAMFLISTPLFAVRVTRAARLNGIERAIRQLRASLSLAPAVAPRGHAGLSARFSF